MRTIILAHRGASAELPENTLEAFSLAVNQQADGIELDVHLSKDGEIVVAHDERLERVSNGRGYINDYTLAELKSLAFGTLPNGSECRIPLMGEVFSLIKPTNLIINIELKTTERLYPELAGKLTALTAEYGMNGRVLYSSFNHYSLLDIKRLVPSARTGLLYELGMVNPWFYANYTGAYAIHPNYRVIAALPQTVAGCHKCGVKVIVWTVDDEQTIAFMLKCGVDGIITNRPDTALRCRRELCPQKAQPSYS